MGGHVFCDGRPCFFASVGCVFCVGGVFCDGNPCFLRRPEEVMFFATDPASGVVVVVVVVVVVALVKEIVTNKQTNKQTNNNNNKRPQRLLSQPNSFQDQHEHQE